MIRKFLIGVDLGTSSTKAALFQVDGRLVAESSMEVPIHTPKPGTVEQDDHDFLLTASKTIRSCIQQSRVDPAEIAAIAFDSQMAGVGLIDENFQPAARFDSWLDMRCQPYIEMVDRECGELVTKLTGCPPTCDHGPKMLWWKNERSDVYSRTARFVMPGTYVAGQLAGLKPDQAFIDYTYIHFSGFADAEKGTWSKELCNRFGLDIEKLPRIVAPWDIVGEINDRGAELTGLKAGTPIAAGAGDTAANALGAGIVKPGMLFDVAGTASVLAGCTDRYLADSKHRALLTMRSVIPGLWNPLAYIGGGGIALRWFRDQFYNKQRNQELPIEESLYPEMIKMAEGVAPGADGLLFSPHLGGRISPSSPQMRGAWLGVSWSHTQAHFFRAILESIGYEYAYYLSILRENLPNIKLVEARVVGGGAKSPAWNQIKADILGVPYQRLAGNEFGTWGAAMIAGKACGLIPDLAEHAARTAHPEGSPCVPSIENHEQYKPLVAHYIRTQSFLSDYYSN